jgi:hypothetical protein
MIKKLFSSALSPFSGQNFKHTLLIPGGLASAAMLALLFSLIAACLMIWEGSAQPFHGLLGLLLLSGLIPITTLGGLFLVILLLGYQWRLIATYQTGGFGAIAPGWAQDEWQTSFMAGLHGVGYMCIVLFFLTMAQNVLGMVTGLHAHAALLDTPIIGDFKLISYTDPEAVYPHLYTSLIWTFLLTVLSLFALMPFILGPLHYNAQNPSLSAILVNLLPAWRWAWSRYLQVFTLSLIGQTLVGLVVVIGGMIFGLTVVGITLLPFLVIAALLGLNSCYIFAFSVPPCLIPESESL